MTNGEKFKEVFQISQTAKGILYEFAWLPNHDVAQFPVEWWNAEYKDCEHCAKTYGTLGCCDTVSNEWVYSCKEGQEEYARGMRKFGSTTKNDLGVDCISRDDAIEVLKDWDGYFIGHSSDDVIKALNLAIKALEHPEKNIVAVVPCGDAVSRAEVLKLMKDNWHTHNGDWAMQESMDDIRALPSVTPQEPTDKIFTKADLDSMAKAINYGWELRVNEVLDKVRAEITDCLKALDEIEKSGLNIYLPNEISGRRLTYQQCLEFIDKYKAESEEQSD